MLRVAKRFASTGFQEELVKVLPSVKVETNPLRLLAIGTDASFYRLTPKLVIHLQSEQELRSILPLALKHQTPVTFRAAGTSLSGQAVTDSVLIKIQPDKWKAYSILSKGQFIQVQPGLIGGEVNQLLKAYKKKIGPDPASIDSCMIGGIAANNASGMCCGTAQNSYHTIRDARLVFADGSVLDTADKESCHNFRTSHTEMISRIAELHHTIHQNPDLVQQITKKFAIKC